MESGRERLLTAARSLLAEHPDREPSTRELYEAAGVAAPTLYHHFGDKDGLLEAVTEQAFAAYLERKRAVPRTGDLLVDFAAGWDMHVAFGVENPVLYGLMHHHAAGRTASRAAQIAEQQLRLGLERLAEAGLLRIDVDEAVAITMAMAIGCVTQLTRRGEDASGSLARSMRMALMAELTGHSQPADAGQAVRLVLARLGSASQLFTSAEKALLRQWLHALSAHFASRPHEREEGELE